MGHYEALCKQLGEKMGIIRLRRNTLRIAHSICSDDYDTFPSNATTMIPKDVFFLKLDSASFVQIPRSEYDNFNCVQQVFWAIDELQQQYLHAAYGHCKENIMIELYWDEDLQDAVSPLYGLIPDWIVQTPPENVNHHVDHSKFGSLKGKFLEYQQQYLKITRKYFTDLPTPL